MHVVIPLTICESQAFMQIWLKVEEKSKRRTSSSGTFHSLLLTKIRTVYNRYEKIKSRKTGEIKWCIARHACYASSLFSPGQDGENVSAEGQRTSYLRRWIADSPRIELTIEVALCNALRFPSRTFRPLISDPAQERCRRHERRQHFSRRPLEINKLRCIVQSVLQARFILIHKARNSIFVHF